MTDDMRERVGSTLAGRYRVTAPLAKGGMGAVFDGVDIDTGEPVAIKLLRKELAESKEALVRFRREIEATERIDAPQIVAVYHADVTDDGTPFMVMEYLEGEPLSARIHRGPLAWSEAFPILDQVLRALKAASGHYFDAARRLREGAHGAVYANLRRVSRFLALQSQRIAESCSLGQTSLGLGGTLDMSNVSDAALAEADAHFDADDEDNYDEDEE